MPASSLTAEGVLILHREAPNNPSISNIVNQPTAQISEASPVELPPDQLKLIKGLSVKDDLGFVNIHNDSSWEVVSLDFLVVISEIDDSGRRETFKYHAVKEIKASGSPYATSRFLFEPFNSEQLTKRRNFVHPILSWEIVAATGLKPQ
jgi:hypothetical protein